ncbi:hypothetical protein IU510_14760 [Nocardia cyriacigeorgica]|nr:hypothetical protein [Nocardia cyriacigeorgica]
MPDISERRTLSFPLLSDEPSTVDLLSFDAIAETVVDAVFDDALDPVAIGVSGAWGSGKTTVLELVKSRIEQDSGNGTSKVLVIPVDPWRFDPLAGPKESLITAILVALQNEIKESEDTGGQAIKLVKRLAKRINWSKAIQMAASTAITLQLPSLNDLPDLINDGEPDSVNEPRGMDQFREEFEELLQSKALAHISRVVVLVDDLDRCLPPTVVQSLEAIRLFLSSKGMSFVIAADEKRVAEAIQHHLGSTPERGNGEETVAELYLHKIVQTTIPLPALSSVDTHAYLFLLLCRASVDDAQYASLVADCTRLRLTEGSLDKLVGPEGVDLDDYLAIAARLTPALYEKHKGNPRRIKRFLNDLNVRHAVASRRGIALEPAATAKLMVLEKLFPDEFKTVLRWLSQNQLRDKLDALHAVANQGRATVEAENEDVAVQGESASENPPDEEAVATTGFSDAMVRWAKLPPTLDASQLSAYLYLAASFSNEPLISDGLPEHLRDIAANLTSSSKVDRTSVSNENLRALSDDEARQLIDHLSRSTRDQPAIQKFSVPSILRIADTHPTVRDAIVSGLKRLPAKDLDPATVLLFKDLDQATYQPLFDDWLAGNPAGPVRTAIHHVAQVAQGA